jgi:hypothetical protein
VGGSWAARNGEDNPYELNAVAETPHDVAPPHDARVVADAINAASSAAANAVYEYAHKFRRRDDYLPLEDLAAVVQRRAVEAAATVLGADYPRCPSCGTRTPTLELLERHRLRRCYGLPGGRSAE